MHYLKALYIGRSRPHNITETPNSSHNDQALGDRGESPPPHSRLFGFTFVGHFIYSLW